MRTLLKTLLSNELSTPHLYIDPNTGGMLFQFLAVFLALFSGILFFFSRQIRTVFARLRRKFQRGQSEDIEAENPNADASDQDNPNGK